MAVFPDFLIVGAPKCATTSLAHYLGEHEKIFIPTEGEPHFYTYVAEERPHWGVGSVEDYVRLFEDADSEQLYGEKSTWYLYSSTAAEQIQKYAPDTKCIALLRQPVDRAYSHWSFRIQNDWETLGFREAIAAEQERIENGAFWGTHYMHAGRYHEQLLRFYDRLGPEQVLVLWFEDLARDSAAVVREALSFLGLAPNDSSGTDEAHNTTTLPRSQMLNRLRRSPLIRRVAHAFPDTIRVLCRKVYQRLNMAERPSLDPNVRAELTARLAPDIKRLQRLLDEDLSHWIE
ncbi:hypothetical protein GGQ20_001500 [Salinibacter ruber]|uniref:sulfotransferase family protein n=1 Tax=Salinibacter ruber TaxID=146919 RepID=UPI0021674AC8|nr:sulfotransferase [Salinibacter ruber]MCS3700191.1 hypothetical protein [Salinibacter ruber]